MSKFKSSFDSQNIDTKNVLKLIEKLNLSKASGYDEISSNY